MKDGPSELTCFLLALGFVLVFLGISLMADGTLGSHAWAWVEDLADGLVDKLRTIQ